jgi:hypothetical protein
MTTKTRVIRLVTAGSKIRMERNLRMAIPNAIPAGMTAPRSEYDANM